METVKGGKGISNKDQTQLITERIQGISYEQNSPGFGSRQRLEIFLFSNSLHQLWGAHILFDVCQMYFPQG
jgi:hypothetical protein